MKKECLHHKIKRKIKFLRATPREDLEKTEAGVQPNHTSVHALITSQSYEKKTFYVKNNQVLREGRI